MTNEWRENQEFDRGSLIEEKNLGFDKEELILKKVWKKVWDYQRKLMIDKRVRISPRRLRSDTDLEITKDYLRSKKLI